MQKEIRGAEMQDVRHRGSVKYTSRTSALQPAGKRLPAAPVNPNAGRPACKRGDITESGA